MFRNLRYYVKGQNAMAMAAGVASLEWHRRQQADYLCQGRKAKGKS